MNEYPNVDNRRGKPPKFMYFNLFDSKKPQRENFSKLISKFVQTMGTRPFFVNLNDGNLLGVVPVDKDIDAEAIRSAFYDVIESIEVRTELKPEDKVKNDL